MATAANNAPRKDLLSIILTVLLIIMVGVMGYRYLTKSTNADRLKDKEESESMKRITEAKPGDAQSFASRLKGEVAAEKQKADIENRNKQDGTGKNTTTNDADRAAVDAQRKAAQDEAARIEADRIEREKLALAIRSSKMNAYDANSPAGIGNDFTNSGTHLNSLLALLGGAPGSSSVTTPGQATAAATAALAANSGAGSGAAGAGGSGLPPALAALLGGNSAAGGASGRSQDQASRSWVDGQQSSSLQSPLTPTAVSSAYTLHQGSIIPSVLISAVDSDLPGDLRAQVSMDVYDSVTLRNLLIPKSTVLVGAYNNEVVAGQQRILFGFSRMIFPNGSSVSLIDTQGRGNFRGSERNGKAGIAAEVNNRFWEIFGPSLLIGVVTNFTKPLTDVMTNWLFPAKVSGTDASATSTETGRTVTTEVTDPKTGNKTTTVTTSTNANNSSSSTGGTNSGTNLTVSLGQATADTASGTLTETARRILDRNQNIKPNLSLAYGEKFNLVVARDMVLPPSITQKRPE
jgi:type IV secretory pathway VirB10-like protein